MRCFHHEAYTYPLPEDHPFPMDKFWRAAAMVRTARPDLTIEAAPIATLDDLRRVHADSYLDAVRDAALSREDLVRLGLPACAALLERSRLEVGGTLAAMRAALADGIACNLAGGTHHAFPDRGLGYCVLNDVAIAIRSLHATQPATRVFVVDTDAHQGNGTNAIFAGDARVFTWSIHVGRNYPSTKTPGSRDVELERYADGATYLAACRASLPDDLRAFAPDLVFWISGADPHENDRFGQLRLTDDDMQTRDRFVLETALTQRAPVVVLQGGGYNRDRVHTARLHANTALLAAELTPRFSALAKSDVPASDRSTAANVEPTLPARSLS